MANNSNVAPEAVDALDRINTQASSVGGQTLKNTSKHLNIGYNAFWPNKGTQPFLYFAKREKGADFVFCHFDLIKGTASEQCASLREMAKTFEDLNVDFVANMEQANFSPDIKTSDGQSYTEQPDGTHRFEFTKEMIEALISQGNLIGVSYDELEHCIINRNASLRLDSKGKTDIPVFSVEGDDLYNQGELLSSQLESYAKRTKCGYNIALCGEHVFPVLFHTFARNGITPNFKSQKESYSNIQFAIAVGAAMQYGTELWNCVDLWYRMTFPGHSSDEMYNNLVFSYLCGADRVYVENANAFFDGDGKLTDYGKAYEKFLDEYKGKERLYDVSDYSPEIGIIKYDDTYWGQCDPVIWRKMLFGNPKIKPDKRSREYTKAFHVITHGESGKNGLSWSRVSPWSLRKHRSFASMNGTAVFDDRVEQEKLMSLKLCFLCGYHISEQTLSAVETLVRENGLTVVTSKRFLPEKLRKSGKKEISDGKGKWIVTGNMASHRVKKAAKPFIGNKGEIHLRFAERDIKLKISEDGNSIDGFSFNR